MTRVDHVIVSVTDLPDAARRWTDAGLVAAFGGTHPWGTSNALVRGPDAAYLELIAAGDSEGTIATRVRQAPGPLSWALAVDDIERAHATLVSRGYSPAPIATGSRTTERGDTLTWRLCDVVEGPWHAFVPFLIQWDSPMQPGPADGPRLTGITVAVPSPDDVAAVLETSGLAQVEGRSGGILLSDGTVDVFLHKGRGRVSEVTFVLADGPTGDVVLDGLTVHRR